MIDGERLTPELIQKVYQEYISRQRKLHPVHSNRASQIGHPCERYLVLDRIAWDKRGIHEVGLQMIFNEGNDQEQSTIRRLMEAGFVIQEAQKALYWKDYQLSAHFDYKIAYRDFKPVLSEFKTMHPNIYPTINSMHDMIHSAKPWIRKYPAQMQVYLLLEAEDEYGFFILKNKSSGEIKIIECRLDYEYAESILQKCERVNGHVANGTLPDFCGDIEVCEMCDHFHRTCDPPMDYGPGIQWIEDPETLKILEAWYEKKPTAAEFEKLNSKKKKRLNGVTHAVIGPFVITGKKTKGGWRTKVEKQ